MLWRRLLHSGGYFVLLSKNATRLQDIHSRPIKRSYSLLGLSRQWAYMYIYLVVYYECCSTPAHLLQNVQLHSRFLDGQMVMFSLSGGAEILRSQASPYNNVVLMYMLYLLHRYDRPIKEVLIPKSHILLTYTWLPTYCKHYFVLIFADSQQR